MTNQVCDQSDGHSFEQCRDVTTQDWRQKPTFNKAGSVLQGEKQDKAPEEAEEKEKPKQPEEREEEPRTRTPVKQRVQRINKRTTGSP